MHPTRPNRVTVMCPKRTLQPATATLCGDLMPRPISVRGRKGGRRPKLTDKQIAHARALLADRNTTITDVASSLGVNRSTIYRALGLGAFGMTAE